MRQTSAVLTLLGLLLAAVMALWQLWRLDVPVPSSKTTQAEAIRRALEREAQQPDATAPQLEIDADADASLVGPNPAVLDYQLALQGRRLAWRSREDGDTRLYVADLSGGRAREIPVGLLATGILDGYDLSPNGQRLLLRLRPVGTLRTSLYVLDLEETELAARRLFPAHPQRGDVTDFQFVPDGDAVVYLANRDDYAQMELYVSYLQPAGHESRLSQPLAIGGNVIDFKLAAGGDWVVYRADPYDDEHYNLFAVELRRPGQAQQLNPEAPDWADVVDFSLDASGEMVLFRADYEEDGAFALYRVSLYAPGLAERLSGSPK